MKRLKRLIALALTGLLVLATAAPAFAAEGDTNSYGATNPHTITITSHGTGAHTYEAYQVFSGNLNAAEGILSDIQWGNGVNGDALLTALKADTTIGSNFTAATTSAQDVAKILEAKTDDAAFLQAFADVVSNNLGTKAGDGTTSGTSNKAEISVTGDGYYFIKDVTTSLPDGDTASKYMLKVVKDITVEAKDTVLTPDKKILKAQGQDFTRVKEDTAAVGDTVTFEVTIPVPDTTAYKDHFVFNMTDQLPAGLTFTGVSSVKIDGTSLPGNNYEVKAKAGDAADTAYAEYTAPADPVAAEGGQTIKVVFKDFKKYVEDNKLIGKDVVVTYTAVVNDDAVYGSTGNENEVEFIYSNNPNHDYDGDEPGPDDPTGNTPESKTKTFVAGIEILKVDGSNSNPLANAEFEFTSNVYNKTVTKGVKYEKAPYTAADGETVETGDYWKLKDGSYTSQDPNAEGMNQTQYDNPDEKYVKVSWNKIVLEPAGEGESKKVTIITGSDGIIDVKGLKPGTYTIKETHAPDGYNKIDTEYTIVIDWDPTEDGTAAKFKLGTGTTEGVTLISDSGSANAIYKLQVENNKGTELPTTGGIGTTLFYLIGSVLVVGAGVILVARRRMSA